MILRRNRKIADKKINGEKNKVKEEEKKKAERELQAKRYYDKKKNEKPNALTCRQQNNNKQLAGRQFVLVGCAVKCFRNKNGSATGARDEPTEKVPKRQGEPNAGHFS